MLGALLACGCAQQEGNRGQLTFYDDTDTWLSGDAIQPIAARANIHMTECCAPERVLRVSREGIGEAGAPTKAREATKKSCAPDAATSLKRYYHSSMLQACREETQLSS